MPCSLAVPFDSPVGRHCCLWCQLTSSDLKKSPSARSPVFFRSDVTMQTDLARFQAQGSNIAYAKEFNNVIREPLFEISITQVGITSEPRFNAMRRIDVGMPTWTPHHVGNLL